MASGEKRSSVELPINQKKLVLDELGKGRSHRSIAADFGISKTTVGNILRNRESVLSTWSTHADSNHIYRNRKRKTRCPPVQLSWHPVTGEDSRFAFL